MTIDLTAIEALNLMARGEATSEELTRAALTRITARDTALRAWITMNPRAVAQAAVAHGPLAGVTVAVKDVIDTGDMPTTHNSPIYGGNRPAADAPCVSILRQAGAVVLGKADTTEFAACGRDAATANPHDVTRTPGGSSSGTAAAVADGHAMVGLGTQTGGSTIRPASFCGVYGFKPSWGLISTEGVKRYAVSFDTVGLFARDVADLELLADVYALPEAPEVPKRRLKLGICRTPYFDRAEPELIELFATLAERLAPVADLVPFDLPEGFEAADELHRCIMHCEGASAFLNLARTQPELLHRDFHDRVELALGYTQRDHFEAYDRLAVLRMGLEKRMERVDGILAPSAPGFAPKGRGAGNPIFNAMWTAMQVPVLNLPASGFDLPLGVSLIGRRAFDRQVLKLGARIAPSL